METGIVKFFDSRDNKRFGFITVDVTGEEIFFHFNDGETFCCSDEADEPEFHGLSLRRDQGDPRKGDRIVFSRGRNKKGDKASPWGFASDYERMKAAIAEANAWDDEPSFDDFDDSNEELIGGDYDGHLAGRLSTGNRQRDLDQIACEKGDDDSEEW